MAAGIGGCFSRLEVEEIKLGEAREIRIERDDAAAAGEGKGGEVGVRPKALRKIRGERERGKGGIERSRFRQEVDDGHR